MVAIDNMRDREDEMRDRFHVLAEKAVYESDKRATAKEFASELVHHVVDLSKDIVRGHVDKMNLCVSNCMHEIECLKETTVDQIRKDVLSVTEEDHSKLIAQAWSRNRFMERKHMEEIATSRSTATKRERDMKDAFEKELRCRCDSMKEQFEAQQQEIRDELVSRVRTLESELRGVSIELDRARERERKLEREKEELRINFERPIQAKNERIEDLEDENAHLQEQIDILQERVSLAGKDLREVEGRWGNIEKKMNDLKDALERKTTEVEVTRRELQKSETETRELRNSARANTEELSKHRRLARSTGQERDDLERKLRIKESKLKKLESSHSKLRKDHSTLQAKFETISGQLTVSQNKCELMTSDKFRTDNELRVARERAAALQIKLFRAFSKLTHSHESTKKKTKKGGIASAVTSLLVRGSGKQEETQKDVQPRTGESKNTITKASAASKKIQLTNVRKSVKFDLNQNKASPSTRITTMSDDDRNVNNLEVERLKRMLARAQHRESAMKEEQRLVNREKDLLLSQLTLLLRQYKVRLEKLSEKGLVNTESEAKEGTRGLNRERREPRRVGRMYGAFTNAEEVEDVVSKKVSVLSLVPPLDSSETQIDSQRGKRKNSSRVRERITNIKQSGRTYVGNGPKGGSACDATPRGTTGVMELL